ncbi:hypothetical protein [Kitasatospora terrestris]|uniref:hypothetical protein n=1 Tax=Kitasatospora terrestris TaxID=258051 RepID=UPI0031EBBD3E
MRSRRTLWVVLGCVGGTLLVTVGLLGYFVYDTAASTGRNRIVLPPSFQGLAADPDGSTAKELAAQLESGYARGSGRWTPTALVSAVYRDAATGRTLVAAGAYGHVLRPSDQVDTVFDGAAAAGDARTDGRRDVDPGPLGGRMSCATTESQGRRVGFCAWADGSTVMTLVDLDAAGKAVDLDRVAAAARELRQLSEIPK